MQITEYYVLQKIYIVRKAFLKYYEADLKYAIIEIKEKYIKIQESARRRNIPHSNVRSKRKGQIPQLRKMKPPIILTPAVRTRSM